MTYVLLRDIISISNEKGVGNEVFRTYEKTKKDRVLIQRAWNEPRYMVQPGHRKNIRSSQTQNPRGKNRNSKRNNETGRAEISPAARPTQTEEEQNHGKVYVSGSF